MQVNLAGRLTLFFMCLGSLAGCQIASLQDVFDTNFPEIESDQPVPMPELRIGQYFSYDNHRTEVVANVNGDLVTWRNNRGFKFLRERDFSKPYLKWEWEGRLGILEYLSEAESLWPLDAKTDSRFVARYTVKDSNYGSSRTYSFRRWYCKTGKRYRVTVKAGTFDAVRLECIARYGRKSAHHRVWYYSEDVGHYVLREDYYAPRGKRRRIELVSWGMMPARFPEEIKSVLKQARQMALEKNESGEEIFWSQRDKMGREYSGAITPIRTYKTSKGFWCRDYQIKYYQNGKKDIVTNQGACRDKEGQWIDRK